MTAAPTGIAVLRSATLFSLTRTAWSNYRKADKSLVTSGAADGRVNVTKKLIESPALDAVHQHLNDAYNWCLARAMPSTAIRRGIYFVKNDQVPVFETRLAEARRHLHEVVVPALLTPAAGEIYSPYELAKQAAQRPANEGGLGDLYNEKDYPTPEALAQAFEIKWSWLHLSVPDELPDEIREREVAKLKTSFLEAQEEIKFALRAGFKELVSHAVERLTPDADGKRKVFCESTFEKFTEFFDTFNARNLLEDTELEAVVNQAKEIISGLPSVDDLRSAKAKGVSRRLKTAIKSGNQARINELQEELKAAEQEDGKLLEETVAKFAEVDAVLVPLVVASRKFDFSPDEV